MALPIFLLTPLIRPLIYLIVIAVFFDVTGIYSFADLASDTLQVISEVLNIFLDALVERLTDSLNPF